MSVPTLTKDFHRLLKRIGRLTEGQASIDGVNWDDGNLTSFGVTIRPNASYYKGGRFKFTVRLPDQFSQGMSPSVWCETDIYHPNIDRHEVRVNEYSTNVCLNILDDGYWSETHGLEGVVLGLLFLMHNPNINDPLSTEFDCDSLSEEEFRTNVIDYLAGRIVDGEFKYFTDFRVIDGEFEDVSIDSNSDSNSSKTDEIICARVDTNPVVNSTVPLEERHGRFSTNADVNNGVIVISKDTVVSCKNTDSFQTADNYHGCIEADTSAVVDNTGNDNCDENVTNSSTDKVNTEGDTNIGATSVEYSEGNDGNRNANYETLNDSSGNILVNTKVNTTLLVADDSDAFSDSDDEEEVMPVRFVFDTDYHGLAYFVVDFVGNHTDIDNNGCDDTSNSAKIPKPDCDESVEEVLDVIHERSKSLSNINEMHEFPVALRSLSVPNDFQVKLTYNRNKPVKELNRNGFRDFAYAALNCILTVYRNML